MPESGQMTYEQLLKERITCKGTDCNNGCPIAKAVREYRYRIGAISIDDTAPKEHGVDYIPALSRELLVMAETMLDVDGTMVGNGELRFCGSKEISEDGKPNGHCNLIVVRGANGGGKYFVPDLSGIKKELVYRS